MSSADDFDIAETLRAKSDQLNAADLSGQHIRVQILGARRMGDDRQPVAYRISGGHMPWRPPKAMRRVMSEIAGNTRTGPWLGMWVELYRDERITYGKDPTGGVRISGVDSRLLPAPKDFTVRDSKGYLTYAIRPILAGEHGNAGAPTANLDALLAEHDLTRADVDAWRAGLTPPKGPLADLPPEQVAGIAAWFASDLARLDLVRAAAATTAGNTTSEADEAGEGNEP